MRLHYYVLPAVQNHIISLLPGNFPKRIIKQNWELKFEKVYKKNAIEGSLSY